MQKRILFFFLVFFISNLEARILHVGPNKNYHTPSQVSTVVRDGDTVYIEAGIYPKDVAYWNAHNLYIVGRGGMAHLKSEGKSAGKKAIWVIKGNNTIIENIEFSGCKVPDHNGAGIRQEGVNLTVKHCYFHDNEEGILAGDNPNSKIIVEYSEFGYNGYGRGFTHHIYINHIDKLIVRYCYFHHANVGHHVKSRANNTLVEYNRIGDESKGNSSRLIDLPNGGVAVVIGNFIQQGPNAENSNLVGYGLEGLSNPGEKRLYMVNNTLVNMRHASIFIMVKQGSDAYMVNNIFAGKGTQLSGKIATDDHNFIQSDIGYFGFKDAENYDFSLTKNSKMIDAGTRNYTLPNGIRVTHEYTHPLTKSDRNTSPVDSIDVGANEYMNTTFVIHKENETDLIILPNPCRQGVIHFNRDISSYTITAFSLEGKKLRCSQVNSSSVRIMDPFLGVGQVILRKEKVQISLPFIMLF